MRLSLVLCLSCAALCALADDTTTLTPSSSTEGPITTSSTTTPAPTTPTIAPSTSTTPAPIPVPAVLPLPAAIEYQVKDGNNSCILATFAAQFNIPYNQTNTQSVIGYLNVDNAVVDPSTKCDWNATSLDLKINFENNYMVLSFKNDGTKRWVHQLVLTYTPSNATIFPGHPHPDVPKTETYSNLTLFSALGEKSYFCTAGEQATSDVDNVKAKFANVNVDAFRPQNAGMNYREKQDCVNDDVSDLVPIAVGIALLALVVIVLIAYFIGRRRSRRLAYQSV